MSTLLSFPAYVSQAQALATQLQLPCAIIEVHTFPDQESLVTLPPCEDEHAIIYCGLEHPNNKLIELLLAVNTLKTQGVERFSLLSPYLCYMRQDKAFHQGEVISQKIIGEFLSQLFDDILTIDAHLHRTESLQTVFPDTRSCNLSATDMFSDFIQQQNLAAVLLGPDEESLQWVKKIAKTCQLPYLTAKKQRHGDQKVSIMLPDYDFKEKHVLLVDDVVSSGGTLITICQQLKQAGATGIDALITHALFDENVLTRMQHAGITNIWSSDTIPHITNQVSIIPLISQQVKNWLA